jgi:hypothetical protein
MLKRKYHLDAFLLIQVCFRSELYPPFLETIGTPVPAQYISELSMFNICFSNKYCPSARFASADNVVYRDVDVFGTKTVSLNLII